MASSVYGIANIEFINLEWVLMNIIDGALGAVYYAYDHAKTKEQRSIAQEVMDELWDERDQIELYDEEYDYFQSIC